MEVLAGRYVLEDRLGSGGTATVWRARDTALLVHRAVKVLDVAPGPEREALRERLRNEARAMARLDHPGVVRVHDVGADGERDFIVMDLVDGPSLADRLDSDGPLPPDAAVRLAVQLLAALGAAHAQGIVHRDVKPGNVLLAASGEARLCDFGIALAEASDDRHTRTGAALGSLPYMAPEQRRDARSVGPAADLYAVGCTLYNALTCATPVDLYLAPGASPRWSTVPQTLVAVLRTATAAEPGDRYTDADAMSRALVRALAPPEPVVPEPEPEPVAENRRPAAGGAVWIGLGAVLVSLVVAAVVVVEVERRIAEQRRIEAEALLAQQAEEDDPPQIAGTWQGPWDGESPGAHLVLAQAGDGLEGTVVVHLGPNLRTSNVVGSFDPATRALRLHDREQHPGAGEYVATLDEDGALRGRFERDDRSREAVRFVLVRIE